MFPSGHPVPNLPRTPLAQDPNFRNVSSIIIRHIVYSTVVSTRDKVETTEMFTNRIIR